MTLPIYVGYDEREVIGYHVFCSSVLRRTKSEVSFHPVRGSGIVGSTQFNPGRFRIAEKQGYRGWAIWAECDMLCLADIEELMAHADPYCDVLVAKHNYKTKYPTKFLGQPNPDYPRKNWSSLMLINCNGAAWQRLATGICDRDGQPYTLSDLHRFKFADETRIGALPLEWNWLVMEYDYNKKAKLAHFTIGTPCWAEYGDCDYADKWHQEQVMMLTCAPSLEKATA